jgi:hypothetical protein
MCNGGKICTMIKLELAKHQVQPQLERFKYTAAVYSLERFKSKHEKLYRTYVSGGGSSHIEDEIPFPPWYMSEV